MRRGTQAQRPVLEVSGLTVEYRGKPPARAVDDVSFSVQPGEIVGLIGESGSGKSTIAAALLRLLPSGGRVVSGEVALNGRSIFQMDARALRAVRGAEVAFIPQNAMNSMNPLMSVGDQVAEPSVIHRGTRWRAAKLDAVGLLESVHLPRAAQLARSFPHQLSGGMLQRAMTAMAVSLRPALIVADESTTALDATAQAQILELLKEIRDTRGTAILLITHDLGVVAETCDQVVVVYAGRVLESGPVHEVMAKPSHPYTKLLIAATPTLDGPVSELASIPGQLPSPSELPTGCRFAERCPQRFEKCDEEPPILPVSNGHGSRCWLAEGIQ
jgi:peptide/nickel transport system ATP-binding protein